jgi:hypothetical protein
VHAHVPFLQTPLQHWLSLVHAAGAKSQQRPRIASREQQCSGAAAGAPLAAQQNAPSQQVKPAQQLPPAPHCS